MKMQSKIKIEFADGRVETRELAYGSYTLGRESGDIVLNDPKASGAHAKLDIAHGGVTVTDLNSTNGTRDEQGERLVSPRSLQPGGSVLIGDSRITWVAPVTAKGTMIAMDAPETPSYLRPSGEPGGDDGGRTDDRHQQSSTSEVPPQGASERPSEPEQESESWRTYFMRGVMAAAGLFLVRLVVGMFQGEPILEWECQVMGIAGIQCSIRNTGDAAGEICFDAVTICGDGEHVVEGLCSGQLEPGASTLKAGALRPPIGLFVGLAGCASEFRNEVVK